MNFLIQAKFFNQDDADVREAYINLLKSKGCAIREFYEPRSKMLDFISSEAGSLFSLLINKLGV